MAYYAAVISLKNTIERLLSSSHISILRPSQEILEFALKVVGSIEKVLDKNEEMMIRNSSNERVKSLNGEITVAAYKLEDALESHVLNQYEIHEGSSQKIFLDFEEVRGEINSFIEMMKKIEKMMMEELSKPLPEEEDDDDVNVVPSKIDFGGKNSKMVGLSKEFNKLKDQIIHRWPSGLGFISIVGMAGIGKTTLAMKLFEDPSISSHFDFRVFASVGLEYRIRKVMLNILAQLNYDIDEIHMEDYANLADYIRTSLQGRRYLIVLDNVWNTKALDGLIHLLPTECIKSRVLLTTRSQEVARYCFSNDIQMSFLNKEESWDLLHEKVFGEGFPCPYQLEKFGKKIAENCEGLPLAIVTVANILSKGEKNLDYWKKTAEKQNSVFTDAYDQMSEVLISSYNYLPQYSKSFFLYVANFPQSCKIPASKLEKLWHSEGFLYPSPLGSIGEAKKCLRVLVSRSIVLVKTWSSSTRTDVKTCYLHSTYWHLCMKEAGKEKFLHAINRYATSFTEGIKSQRRLCIHSNVLLGIKEVHNSMQSISMARSLLCTGPYHQYPVPIYFGLRLLRVLDALTIRFYKFPIEVLKLVQLRYLALTCSGRVPGSISKLRNLEHLIVHRHLSINKSSGNSSYLPIEIWNMTELRHIQVTGGNLPNPCGACLPNLLILSNMSVDICSKEILKSTPSLMKLGIQIELSPDAIEPLCCFDHLSHIHDLKSLKCVVVNPKPKSQVIASITTFPTQLKKLSLSGLGYPWDYMKTIAKLHNLKVLKLRCFAFQGSFWSMNECEFRSLVYLLIEDTDLVHWSGDYTSFSSLNRLIIRHCYKLKEIPSPLLGCHSLDDRRPSMELVDCPSIEASVEQLKGQYSNFDISVRSSLDDEELQS